MNIFDFFEAWWHFRSLLLLAFLLFTLFFALLLFDTREQFHVFQLDFNHLIDFFVVLFL